MSLPAIFDHLWQSTAFAAVAALATLILRNNRARVRHAVWLAASAKFLLPLALLISLGAQIHWPAARESAPTLTFVVDAVSQPFSAPLPIAAPVRPAANQLPAILFAIWICGFCAFSATWWIRWRRLAAIVRVAAPVDLDLPVPARLSASLIEPGIFGILRPVLLLPAGIFDRLTPRQLSAVIAHELHHVDHRDNLAAAFQMFVETVFWFHPLVWWMGRRMVAERERACDEAVLNAGSEPRAYAEAVLNVCKLYVESPLVCMSGITGANLKRRIEEIMTRRIAHDLHAAKKLALALAAFAAVCLPLAIGMLHAPRVAQAQPVAAAPVEPPPVAVSQPRVPKVALLPQAIAHPADPPTCAALNLTNPAMQRTCTKYGPPDSVQTGTTNTIWHYAFLESFNSRVDLAFTPTGDAPQINYPFPVKLFFGGSPQDPKDVAPLVQALNRELHVDSPTDPTTGWPGVHPSMEVYQMKGDQRLVQLLFPMNSLTGRVDVVGQIVKYVDGVKGQTVANVRDYIESAGSTSFYRCSFTLIPGSYRLRLLVREQATGLMYTQEIPFDLN